MKKQDYLDGKPFSCNDSENVVYKRVKTDSGVNLERKEWGEDSKIYKEALVNNQRVYFVDSDRHAYFLKFSSCEVNRNCLAKFGWCEECNAMEEADRKQNGESCCGCGIRGFDHHVWEDGSIMCQHCKEESELCDLCFESNCDGLCELRQQE